MVSGVTLSRLDCIPEENVWALMNMETFFVQEAACTIDKIEVRTSVISLRHGLKVRGLWRVEKGPGKGKEERYICVVMEKR